MPVPRSRQTWTSSRLLLPFPIALLGALVVLVVGTNRGVEPSEGSPIPKISVESRAYKGALRIEMAIPPDAGEIRYTLDGSEPTVESPLYEGSFRIVKTVKLVARTFRDGSDTSDAARRTYVALHSDVARFHSELPVIVIDTFGVKIPRNRTTVDHPEPYVPSILHVIDRASDGVARMTAPASFSGSAGVKARGSSTRGREKASLAVEIQDARGEDRDVSLCGLPADSDWVLSGPLEYDRALVRHAFVYELSRQMGHYAPRTRFVEVFLNEDGGAVEGPVPEGQDYFGVYVLIEKIKRGKNRVALEPLRPNDVPPQDVGGGYILKIDRGGPGDTSFIEGGQRFRYVYPKEQYLSEGQAASMRADVRETFRLAKNPNLMNADSPFAKVFDIGAAIDYHILSEFTKNPDALIFSVYVHKHRGGKLTLGPVWDYDRSLGVDNDDRAKDPHGWLGERPLLWFGGLFRDAEFRKRYVKRWRELRRGVMADNNLLSIIDAMATEIGSAAARNTERWHEWTRLAPGGWPREIDELKTWVLSRATWFDRAVSTRR